MEKGKGNGMSINLKLPNNSKPPDLGGFF